MILNRGLGLIHSLLKVVELPQGLRDNSRIFLLRLLLEVVSFFLLFPVLFNLGVDALHWNGVRKNQDWECIYSSLFALAESRREKTQSLPALSGCRILSSLSSHPGALRLRS